MADMVHESKSPALEYARLLVELHELFLAGKDEEPEAEIIRDRMEQPWYAMTPDQRLRMRGLSEDLYALAEGGPPRVAMDAEQLQGWRGEAKLAASQFQRGEYDAMLAFLRKPMPDSLLRPKDGVPFLQARCWQKLGDLNTAIVFMKAAEKHDSQLALPQVMYLLEYAGRHKESIDYANRILEASSSNPANIAMAGSVILGTLDRSDKDQVKIGCKKVLSRAMKALKQERESPSRVEEYPNIERILVQLIGICNEALGRFDQANAAYDEYLKRSPNDPEVLARIGTNQFFANDPPLLDNLMKAIHFGSQSCIPYLLLAQEAIKNARPSEALGLALEASNKQGSRQLRAVAHQLIAISYSLLGQSIDWIRHNFDEAERLDPENQTIKANRIIAEENERDQKQAHRWQLSKQADINVLKMLPTIPESWYEQKIKNKLPISAA